MDWYKNKKDSTTIEKIQPKQSTSHDRKLSKQNKSNMKHADSRKSSKESHKNKNGIDLYFWKYIKYQKLKLIIIHT